MAGGYLDEQGNEIQSAAAPPSASTYLDDNGNEINTAPASAAPAVDPGKFQASDVLTGPAFAVRHPVEAVKLLGSTLFGSKPETVNNTVGEGDLRTAPRFAAPGSNVPLEDAIGEAAAASAGAITAETMGQPRVQALPGQLKSGVQSALQRFGATRSSAAAAAADEALLKGLGPTKTNPITPADIKAARPFIEEQHAIDPITKENGVTQLRDHADASIQKIEEHIDKAVAANPTDTIAGHATPVADVKAALAGNVKKNFVADGLKAIDEYGVSDDMTVAQAEKVRKQINADMQSQMKAKNNYDRANMRATDPEFAAREALANSLRKGIYGKLEQRGIPGVADLRQTEGSLIKIRNAAESRSLQGGSNVAGTGSTGILKKVGQAVKLGATGAGANAAGPVGAIVGEQVGEAAQAAIAPGKSSRNALIAKAFEKPQTTGPQLPAIPAQTQPVAQLGQGAIPAQQSTAIPAGKPAITVAPTSRAQRMGLILPEAAGESRPIVTPQPGASVQTPAEVLAAKASQQAAQKPNIRIVRDATTGQMTRQYLSSGGGRVLREEPVATAANVPRETIPAKVAPTQELGPTSVAEYLRSKRSTVTPNASGESAASQEAINRFASEKTGAVKRFRIDTRSGNEVPLIGVDAVDATPGPYDVIVKRGPKGEEILDTGAKARPYRPKLKGAS